jgi:septal ring factor EnvC (AmiA/AmiB activator)
MSTTITFPPAAPALKLASRHAAMPSAENWAATLAEERRRLLEDQDALRERETNLREYESRLRSLQAEIEAGRGAPPAPAARATPPPFRRPLSQSPFADDQALQTAWEKLNRARELFEADQAHLRDERIMLSDQQAEVKRREAAVAEREARLAESEQRIADSAAGALPGEPIAAEHTMSAVTRLTRGPFNMARSVFGSKR